VEFDEKAWIAKVKATKTSEELRALLREIPDDYDGAAMDPGAKSLPDSIVNTRTGKTWEG